MHRSVYYSGKLLMDKCYSRCQTDILCRINAALGVRNRFYLTYEYNAWRQ